MSLGSAQVSSRLAGTAPAARPAAAAAIASGQQRRQLVTAPQRQRQQQRPGHVPRAAWPSNAAGGVRSRRRQLLPAPGAAAVAPTSSIDIENILYNDGCFTVQGCLLSPASPDTVYQVLTDYEALPRVFHNIEDSLVRHCPDTGRKQVVQTCKWAFLVFSGTFENELNVEENAIARQLTFSLVESAFMRDFVGSWDVRHSAEGLTEVRHRLAVRPKVAPPQKVGDLSKRIFKKQVVGILEDLSRELDARV